MKGDYGYTPIYWAAEKCHTDTVKILLDRGANIEERSNTGYTPIHWAVEYVKYVKDDTVNCVHGSNQAP